MRVKRTWKQDRADKLRRLLKIEPLMLNSYRDRNTDADLVWAYNLGKKKGGV